MCICICICIYYIYIYIYIIYVRVCSSPCLTWWKMNIYSPHVLIYSDDQLDCRLFFVFINMFENICSEHLENIVPLWHWSIPISFKDCWRESFEERPSHAAGGLRQRVPRSIGFLSLVVPDGPCSYELVHRSHQVCMYIYIYIIYIYIYTITAINEP